MKTFIVRLELFAAGDELESLHIDAVQAESKEAAEAAVADKYNMKNYRNYAIEAVALDLSVTHQPLFSE